MKTHAIRIACIALGLFVTATAGFSMNRQRAFEIRMHEVAAARHEAIRAEIHREHREMRELQAIRTFAQPVYRVATPVYRSVATPVMMNSGGGCGSHSSRFFGW